MSHSYILEPPRPSLRGLAAEGFVFGVETVIGRDGEFLLAGDARMEIV